MKINLSISDLNLHPLAPVKGTCQWDSGSDSAPKFIKISLLWFIRKRNYKNYHTITIVDQKEISNPHKTGVIDFDFKLPIFPYTYAGELFDLIYAVEANYDERAFVQNIIECNQRN